MAELHSMTRLSAEEDSDLDQTPKVRLPRPATRPIIGLVAGKVYDPAFIARTGLKYVEIDDVENLRGYRQGGFHPVEIGDKLADDRYTIIHKLGFGTFSTVWAAQDSLTAKMVAVKIIVARSSNTFECKALAYLQEQDRADEDLARGKRCLPRALDQFQHVGPNGTHACLVFDMLRCSVHDVKVEEPPWLFRLDVARSIAAQLIFAVHFLHMHAIVHGDIHIKNVMFRMPFIDDITIESFYKKYGEPHRETIRRWDGLPLEVGVPPAVVRPAQLGKRCITFRLQESDIVLADFGECWCPEHGQRRYVHCALGSYPPEAHFDKDKISYPADIWMLACTIFELFGVDHVFALPNADVHDILARHVAALGTFPDSWWSSWAEKDQIFNEDGSWRRDSPRIHHGYNQPLVDSVQMIKTLREDIGESMSQEEVNDLAQMLYVMLRYKPDERFSTTDIIALPWMRKWGKPAIEELEATRHLATSVGEEGTNTSDESTTTSDESATTSDESET